MRDIKTIKRELAALRKEMRAAGIKKTSCFNGGLDRETYSWNAKRFALETELKTSQEN
jgi:hypothetical protein